MSIRDTLEVQSPDDIQWLNLLIYGEPGVGKTRLVGSAAEDPRTSPVLLLDFDGGSSALKGRAVDVIQVRSVTQLGKIYEQLKTENEGYYKTVGLDTLTELQKVDMRGIMEELVQRRPDMDVSVPSQREWGISSDHMRQIVRKFRDLDMNTILTCHADVSRDETGVVSYAPMLPGKLKVDIAGFIDIVGYMTSATEGDEVKRSIQFLKTRRVIAKDRTDRLGSVVETPSIPTLWDLISATNNETKDK